MIDVALEALATFVLDVLPQVDAAAHNLTDVSSAADQDLISGPREDDSRSLEEEIQHPEGWMAL